MDKTDWDAMEFARIQNEIMAKNKWIKVSDRLPEKLSKERFDRGMEWSEKVIVIEKGEVYFGNYNIKHGDWRVYNRIGDIQVTHWMPLPEPPKE